MKAVTPHGYITDAFMSLKSLRQLWKIICVMYNRERAAVVSIMQTKYKYLFHVLTRRVRQSCVACKSQLEPLLHSNWCENITPTHPPSLWQGGKNPVPPPQRARSKLEAVPQHPLVLTDSTITPHKRLILACSERVTITFIGTSCHLF